MHPCTQGGLLAEDVDAAGACGGGHDGQRGVARVACGDGGEQLVVLLRRQQLAAGGVEALPRALHATHPISIPSSQPLLFRSAPLSIVNSPHEQPQMLSAIEDPVGNSTVEEFTGSLLAVYCLTLSLP